jgi:hypothetical protein
VRPSLPAPPAAGRCQPGEGRGGTGRRKESGDAAAAAGRFDVRAVAATLPDTAGTLLVDHHLTDGASSGRAGEPAGATRGLIPPPG